MSGIPVSLTFRKVFIASVFGIGMFLIPNGVQSAVNNSATLLWADNQEPDLGGYTVYHGTSQGIYSDSQDAGETATFRYAALESNKTHFFTVTAYDTSGNESLPSPEVHKTIIAPDSELSVSVTGDGTVRSSPAGLSCSSGTCSGTFTQGSSVTLTATPGIGMILSGWSGSCTGTGGCVVPVSTSPASVSVTFAVSLEEQERLAAVAAQLAEDERLAAVAAQLKEEQRLAAIAAQLAEDERLAAVAAAQLAEDERLAAVAAQVKEDERLAAVAAQVKEDERLAAVAAQVKEEERLAAVAAQLEEQQQLAAEPEKLKDQKKLAKAKKVKQWAKAKKVKQLAKAKKVKQWAKAKKVKQLAKAKKVKEWAKAKKVKKWAKAKELTARIQNALASIETRLAKTNSPEIVVRLNQQKEKYSMVLAKIEGKYSMN